MLRSGTSPSSNPQTSNSERVRISQTMNICLYTQVMSCQIFFQSQFDTLFERIQHENQLAAGNDALLASLLPMAENKLRREVTIEELKQV